MMAVGDCLDLFDDVPHLMPAFCLIIIVGRSPGVTNPQDKVFDSLAGDRNRRDAGTVEYFFEFFCINVNTCLLYTSDAADDLA